jgi:membrane protein implicated in regulation of membrane protease activity
MTIHARAEFDYTLDDLADVAWRTTQRSAHARSQRRIAVAVIAVLLGAALGAPVLYLRPEKPWFAFAVGIPAAILFVVLSYRMLPASMRRSLRRSLREHHGDGPHRCVVELHDDHMLWRHANLDWRLAWCDVRAIEPDGDDLVVTSRTGVSVVRGRAFADAAAREQFVATARRLQRNAGASTAEIS